MPRDWKASQEWADENYSQVMLDRSHSPPLRIPHAPPAVHLMNGETHFPTAMSYLSDAQRSDAATVCSGSVVEDIEVESVLSQEDAHQANVTVATATSTTQAHDEHQNFTSQQHLSSSSRVGMGGTSHTVEFAKGPLLQNERPTIPYKPDASVQQQPSSVTPPNEDMGPPLSRTFLLLKTSREGGGHAEAAGGDGAMHEHVSFSKPEVGRGEQDCGSSVEYAESHSVYSQEDLHIQMDQCNNSSTTCERARLLALKVSKVSLSRPCSVKSFGSQAGSETGGGQMDPDDCECSLDVETHSIGTRSNYSQEDCGATLEQKQRACVEDSTTAASETPLLESMLPIDSGRQSPGGTIYKGRGERRDSRYMSLPLKRFHNDGVHPESVKDTASTTTTSTTTTSTTTTTTSSSSCGGMDSSAGASSAHNMNEHSERNGFLKSHDVLDHGNQVYDARRSGSENNRFNRGRQGYDPRSGGDDRRRRRSRSRSP